MVKLYYVKITRCATNKTYDLKKERRGSASHGEGAENTVTTKWSEHSELEHNFNWNFKTLDLKSTIQSFLISCFLDTLLNLFFFGHSTNFLFKWPKKLSQFESVRKRKMTEILCWPRCLRLKINPATGMTEFSRARKYWQKNFMSN